MNLVSLLILPGVISMEHHTALRFVVAAAALAVILGGVLFSKRKMTAIDTPIEGAAASIVADGGG